MPKRTGSSPAKAKRCSWTKEEDEVITRMAKSNPSVDWNGIADSLASLSPDGCFKKTAKQCRERWCNCLNPAIKSSPWSSEEIDTFFRLLREEGGRWARLAQRLPGRTDNAVKNFFHYRLRKIARRVRKGVVSEDMKSSAKEVEHNLFLLNHLVNSYSQGKNPSQRTHDKCVSDIVKASNISYKRICSYLKEYKESIRGIVSGTDMDTIITNQPSVSRTNLPMHSTHPSIKEDDLGRSPLVRDDDFLFISQVLAVDRLRESFITLPYPKTWTAKKSVENEFQPTIRFAKQLPYDVDLWIREAIDYKVAGLSVPMALGITSSY